MHHGTLDWPAGVAGSPDHRHFAHDLLRPVVIKRIHGAELDGLWPGVTRWSDRGQLPLDAPAQPQVRGYRPADVRFAI